MKNFKKYFQYVYLSNLPTGKIYSWKNDKIRLVYSNFRFLHVLQIIQNVYLWKIFQEMKKDKNQGVHKFQHDFWISEQLQSIAAKA